MKCQQKFRLIGSLIFASCIDLVFSPGGGGGWFPELGFIPLGFSPWCMCERATSSPKFIVL